MSAPDDEGYFQEGYEQAISHVTKGINDIFNNKDPFTGNPIDWIMLAEKEGIGPKDYGGLFLYKIKYINWFLGEIN